MQRVLGKTDQPGNQKHGVRDSGEGNGGVSNIESNWVAVETGGCWVVVNPFSILNEFDDWFEFAARQAMNGPRVKRATFWWLK
jgi:hypothetical protein